MLFRPSPLPALGVSLEPSVGDSKGLGDDPDEPAQKPDHHDCRDQDECQKAPADCGQSG